MGRLGSGLIVSTHVPFTRTQSHATLNSGEVEKLVQCSCVPKELENRGFGEESAILATPIFGLRDF